MAEPAVITWIDGDPRWPRARQEWLVQMMRDGVDCTVIDEVLGCSAYLRRRVLRRLGFTSGAVRGANLEWNAEADAALRRLWGSSMAVPEIARALEPVMGRLPNKDSLRARAIKIGLPPRRAVLTTRLAAPDLPATPREAVERVRGVSLAPVAFLAGRPAVPLTGADIRAGRLLMARAGT
jgi:hypothetical protein